LNADSTLSAFDVAVAPPSIPAGQRAPPAVAAAVAPPVVSADERFTREWVLFLVAALLLGGLLAAVSTRNRDESLAAERERLLAQAHVVEQNVAQQLEGLARALSAVATEGAELDPASPRASALGGKLLALSDAIPGVRSMVLVNAAGRVVLSTVDDWQHRDFSERAWFTAPKAEADLTRLYMSPPWRTALGRWTMPVSRVVGRRDGSFDGVAVAALDPEYFEVLLRSVRHAPDMQVAIAHDSGLSYVAEPARVDPGARLSHGRRVDPPSLRLDHALVVTASRLESAVLAPWRQQTLERTLALVAAILGLALVLRHTQRRRAAYAALEAEAQRERQRSAERLELAAQAATLCLWDWDAVRDRYDELPVLVERLGYEPGEIEPLGTTWRDLVHPGDRPALVAAVQAHVRGDSEYLEAEFRVRHKNGRWVWLLSRARAAERDTQGRALRVVGTHLDTTARRRAESALQRSTDMLRRTGELGRIGGWELDVETGELTWSEEVYRIHEVDPSVKPYLAMAIDFYDEPVRVRMEEAVRAGVEHGTPWDLELPFTTAKGRPRWVRAQGVALFEDGRPTRLTGAFQDITERKTTALELQRLNAELTRLSTTDALTEIGNRRQFDLSLAREWSRAARQEGREPLALVMVDIDHFKDYNDHYGHPSGDAVLTQVAKLLGEAARSGSDLVARYGGEEFALLLPGADLDTAVAIAGRCRALVAEAKIEHRASSISAWLTLSIGVAAQRPTATLDPRTLVDTADAALYRAKRTGRDRIES
jgi:diguanylate cyclase (GGDEF)-like protein/PAS domain S-box-containing protein